MADRKRREPPEPGAAWLEELQTRVREATARLGELREENRGLAARVEELEAAAAAGGEADTADAAEAGDWPRERREIRRRVERLTGTLEDLLG